MYSTTLRSVGQSIKKGFSTIIANNIRKSIHTYEKESQMTLQILSFVRLSDKQMELIHQSYPDCTLRCIRPKDLKDDLSDVDILLGYDAQMEMEKYLPQMPHLKWIHTYSAGVEKLLSHEVFCQSDILLTNSRGIHGIPMAEHVLGTMLASSRCLIEAWENQKAHVWKRLTDPDELFGKTAAIIGLGSIGREVAKHLKNMGMRIVAVKQKESTEPFVDQLFTIDHLSDALSCADYIIVTLPLTPQTKKLFNTHTFHMMKENAFFINVSRGDVVEEDDLVEALRSKCIRGASLDVFATEPLPEDSPLWGVPNLFITPHYSAISPMYLDRSLKIFRNNLQIFPKRIGMLNVVDKQRGY